MTTARAALLVVLALAAGCGRKHEDDRPSLVSSVQREEARTPSLGQTPVPPSAAKESKEKPKEAQAYTRDEFRKLISGKTGDDVLKLLGRPTETSEYSRYDKWTYRIQDHNGKQLTSWYTHDPISGKKDGWVRIELWKTASGHKVNDLNQGDDPFHFMAR